VEILGHAVEDLWILPQNTSDLFKNKLALLPLRKALRITA
jgi:hypothetical protein